MRKYLIILAVSLLLGLAGYSEGTPAARIYEPFTPTPEYMAAYDLVVQKGLLDEGVGRFAQLAALHPGTTMGAVCLLRQAYWSPPEEQAAIYRAVIAGYPGSHFEIRAKLSLLDIQYSSNLEAWQGAADQLAQSYGGPALRDILNGPNTLLSAQVKALNPEVQQGLLTVYFELQGSIACMQNRYSAALPLALFNRETFAQFDTGQLLAQVKFDLEMARFGTWKGEPLLVANPDVRILNPREGQVKGPRPKIRFQATVGDYRYAQVDLGKVVLKVDGQSVTSQMTVRSHVRKTLKTKPNSLFERLRFKYRPTQRLSAGTHTVEVVVPTIGYSGTGPGVTRTSWTFQVRRDRDDPEDERIDDGDDDGWDTAD